MEGGGEWKSGLCGVVHVRVSWLHCAVHRLLRHAFTCRHKATMPEATQEHTHETRDTQSAVECVVEQVCVSVRSVVAPCFSARGEMRRDVASSGAHRPHSTLAVHACAYYPREGGRWKEEVSGKVACAVLCMCACPGCTVLCTVCCVTRSHADTRPQCQRQHRNTHTRRETHRVQWSAWWSKCV